MFNINDISKYKTCRKKQVEYWVCKPPEGTIVFNKFEQYKDLLALRNQLPQLQKRDFLTVDESMELRKTNPKLFEYIVHLGAITTKQRCMVIYGTQGELYLTDYTTVCTMFRVFYNDAWVGLNTVVNSRTKMYNNESVMEWCKAMSCSNKTHYYACFVPKEERGVPVECRI